MGRLFPRVSLRTRFALTLAPLVFAVAGLFGGVVGQRSIDQLRERVGQSLAVDAQRIADRLNQEMSERSRDLALLGALDPVRNLQDVKSVQSLLDSLRRSEPDFLWLAVTDLQGNAIAATDGALAGNDLYSLTDLRDQLRGRPNSGADPLRIVRPGETEQPSIERQRQITISRPIRSADGSAVGVIVAQLSWEWMRDSIRSLVTPDDDGVVNRQTLVVSSYDTVLIGPSEMVGRRLVIPEISRARVGIFGWSARLWPDNHDYIAGVNFAAGDRQFSGPGSLPMRWAVLIREDENTAFAPARQLRFAILLTGVALSLGIALLGWLISGLITRPLRQIAAAADGLRRGEAVELPILRGSSEVEMLSSSLRAMVATLSSKQIKLDELESATQHDTLTGLLNRAGLQSWLTRALAEARTEPSGLLVLVGDLDGFKQVNDSKGHGAGDNLLQEVARRLQSSVRSRDAVARIGGDEFVVVLHAPLGLVDRLALETSHRLWSRVTEPYVIAGEQIAIGLSLGGAGWPEDDRQLDLVLNKADAALYAAKRAGKGRIVFHRELALG